MRWVLSVLIVTAPLVAVAQPFDGTAFISPNVLTAADPTSLVSIKYIGRYLFQVSYERGAQSPEPGLTAGQIEFQVNPEFGSPEAAQVEVETFAPALGRLPLVVTARLADIHVNAGDELFGAGVSGLAHSITIHTDYGHRMLRDGFLEKCCSTRGRTRSTTACGLRGLAGGAGGRWRVHLRERPRQPEPRSG